MRSVKLQICPISRNTPISLGGDFGALIEQQISGGRNGSAREVVRAGLRLLEDNETRLSALRSALTSGESSCASAAFDVNAFLKTKRQKVMNKTVND